jgi:hypothetical protein
MTDEWSRGLLGSLPSAIGTETRQVSAENPTGEKGGGCRAEPDPGNPDLVHSRFAVGLGRGWKVRPFIRLPAGKTATLADIRGPGCISQVFLTSDLPQYRALVLRIHWDDEELPSVEVPLGDLFAMGHDAAPHTVSSLAVTVAPRRGCSCWWQMPFRTRARVTLEHRHGTDANVVAYRVLYHPGDVDPDAGYFHAQWRRGVPPAEHPEHEILGGVRGVGAYVGTYLAWTARSPGWWGEGEVKFWIDGDAEFPTMADNGTEDYFGGAWGFTDPAGNEQTFSAPFTGLSLATAPDDRGERRFSMYRWHLLDPVGFRQDLRVAVQSLGWNDGGTYRPRADEIGSVAYWYQREPHAPFPAMPPVPDPH